MIGASVLAVGFIMKIIAALFIICCVAMVLIVLIQKGKGGGLSTALAGGVASGILGSKTGDFLTWVTIVLMGVFLALAVLMVKFYRPKVSDFGAGPPARQEQPVDSEAAPGTPAPSGAESNLPGG